MTEMIKQWIDEGPAKTAISLFVLFIVVSAIVTMTSFTLPEPAAWLEAWLKVFQTMVSIVVLLKIVWNIPEILTALRRP
jgi:hypothetical protein